MFIWRALFLNEFAYFHLNCEIYLHKSVHSSVFCSLNFLIGGKLLYNVVLDSAIQQHKSVIYIYTHIHVCVYICIYHFPLEPPSIPPSHPSRSSQSASLRSLCYLATSHYFTHDSVYMSMLLSQFVPPSPCPTGSTSPFYTRFISTIFSSFHIYMC